MPRKTLIIALATVLPALAFNMPVYAATAHNLETGAHTKNANDTADDANMKQKHMKHMKHMKKM